MDGIMVQNATNAECFRCFQVWLEDVAPNLYTRMRTLFHNKNMYDTVAVSHYAI